MPLEICWKSELLPVAQRFADREAVHDASGSASYREIFDRAAGAAEGLRRLGIGPGDVAATFFRNSRRAVEAAYGVLLSGGCDVSINAHLAPDDVRYCLNVSKARIVLTDRRGAGELNDLQIPVVMIEDLGALPLALLAPVPVEPNAWARMVFTSGTTGRPKGIIHTHVGRWTSNLLLRASLPTPPKERNVLMLTPFSHGSSLLTFAFLDGGGSVTLLDGLEVGEVTRRLESGRCDQFFASPTILAKLLPMLKGRRLERVRMIYCGTASLAPELYEKVRAVFGPIVRVTYGKTEVFNPITVLSPDETDRFYTEGPSEMTCVGWPASGVEIRIGNGASGSEDEEARGREPGPILLRTRHMLAGIVSESGFQPHSSADFHRTGDIGYLDDLGRLHLCGREADVMKTGGYKIAPEEVEAKLRPSLAAGELVVFGCPSAYWGEIITLAVEGADAGWRENMEDILSTMTPFKRPRLFLELEELPRNAMGKVSRAAVREEVLRRFRVEDGARPRLVPLQNQGAADGTKSFGSMSSQPEEAPLPVAPLPPESPAGESR